MVLTTEITADASNNFDSILHILPDETDVYYNSTGSDGISRIRCPEGYVFEDSYLLNNKTNKDVSIINYSGNNWLDSYGNVSEWNPRSGNIRCKRKYCEPLSVIDSQQEYDVIVDDLEDSEKIINCNDGYIFNTTNTKNGRVRCGAIPIMNNDDILKENKVAWLVDNPYAERLCSENNDETNCNLQKIGYILSDDENTLYEIDPSLNCTWIPKIDQDETTGFKRESGQCKYIHRADLNKSDPICKSMYCSSKEIPNSNRTENSSGPLPGPETGSIHGDCVDFDGKIINNITNSSDCSCFKHKSCDICTDNENCQWCGYNDDGEGGFCYSTKTHLEICNSGSVHNNRGGTCKHVKTNRDKLPEPEDGWTEETCNESVCVKKSYWDSLYDYMVEDINNINEFYDFTKISEEECEDNNNEWDRTARIHAPDKCIVKNTRLDNIFSIQSNIEYFPIRTDVSPEIKFNISDEICKPITVSSYDDIYNCSQINNKSECNADDNCNWESNQLRDSLFNWSDVNKINFNENNIEQCPILNSIGNNLSFEIDTTSHPGYITLSNSLINNNDSITNTNYIENCKIIGIDDELNIIDNQTCMMLGGFTENHYCEPPNIRYCDIQQTVKDNSQGIETTTNACPSGSFVSINGEDIPGCRYYEENPGINNYYCYDTLVDYKCSSNDTLPYNCEKDLVSENTDTNQANCISTGYTIIDDTGDLINISSDNNDSTIIKNYLKCDTSEDLEHGAKEKCNLIGQQYASWGKLCVDNLENKYPIKQICRLANPSEGATWGKYIDQNNNNLLDWGCFRDNGSKYTDNEICSLLGTQNDTNKLIDTNNSQENTIVLTASSSLLSNIGVGINTIPENSQLFLLDGNGGEVLYGSIISPISIDTNTINVLPIDGITITLGDYIIKDLSGTTIANCNPENILNVLYLDTTEPNRCIIDGSFTGNTYEDYKQICEASSDHTIGLKFLENSDDISLRGKCQNIKTKNEVELDKSMCIQNNYDYVPHYVYNDIGTCGSIGDSQLRNQPDLPTTWTGGDISTDDDGIHRSECSPSIMSNCNVSCNPGYGGGGEYICQYNSGSKEFCEIINNKDYSNLNSNKQEICLSLPSCNYDESTEQCTHNDSYDNDGHLEWIGSPCYVLDNTAFSHGIAKLPELDTIFPPFLRVCLYLLVYGFILYILLLIFTKITMIGMGKITDSILNFILSFINFTINIFKGPVYIYNKLFPSEMGITKKISITGIVIVYYVSLYLIVKFSKPYIIEFREYLRSFNFDIINRIKYGLMQLDSENSNQNVFTTVEQDDQSDP